MSFVTKKEKQGRTKKTCLWNRWHKNNLYGGKKTRAIGIAQPRFYQAGRQMARHVGRQTGR